MRLLRNDELYFKEFIDDQPPRYAILWHRSGDDAFVPSADPSAKGPRGLPGSKGGRARRLKKQASERSYKLKKNNIIWLTIEMAVSFDTVGIFVGGTAGIGEFALKAFAQKTKTPKIYIVGRNATAASIITEQAKELNPGSEVVFIKADTSLIKNVDAVCKDIQSKEDKINFLFMTTGYLTFDGRNETSEGIDKKFCLNYYSRMRFVHNLLPELTAASKEPNSLSRVVTILSAGSEGPLIEDDLELKHNFSLRNCGSHAVVMNDFACEELAKQHPGTAFVHVYPGFVKTGILDHGGMLMKVLGMVAQTVLSPMAVSPEESGERNLFHGSASMFAPRATAGEDAAVGSDGTKGSGAYLVNWNGKKVGNQKILNALREKQMGKTIWEHTLEVFRRVEQTGPHA